MKHFIAPTAVALIGATFFLLREPILKAVGDFLIIQDTLQPADVIHVIGGPDDRTDRAIELLKLGYGKQLFFTGGWCTIHGYYHGQHGAERAEAQRIDPALVAIDDSRVNSTYDEAVLVKQFVERSQVPIRSVIVVSDAFHGRRAILAYHLVFGDRIAVQFAPVPFEASTYKRRWWTDAASQQYVKDEYVKLLYYYARYRLSGGPIRQWLASLDRE